MRHVDRGAFLFAAIVLLIVFACAGCSGLEYSNENGPRGPERVSLGKWQGFGNNPCDTCAGPGAE